MTVSDDRIEPNADVRCPQGMIRYRDVGRGQPIVFVHGLLVDGTVWRKVVALLAREFRCIVPDWPMASHRVPMSPTADLSALGVARLAADFLATLQLDGVTLVGSDTGGAICQLVATRHPDRLARLVLTNCDACDDFPPFPFNWTPYVARTAPVLLTALMQPTRLAWVRRQAIRLLTKYPVPDHLLERWARPALDDRDIRRDGFKLVRSLSPRLTREAAAKLREFHRPVLLIWATEDRWFKLSNAERLAATIKNAHLELVHDSRAFVQEDQPEQFAELVRSFVHRTTSEPALR